MTCRLILVMCSFLALGPRAGAVDSSIVDCSSMTDNQIDDLANQAGNPEKYSVECRKQATALHHMIESQIDPRSRLKIIGRTNAANRAADRFASKISKKETK